MRTKILVTLIAFGFLAACSKNTYNTKPTLKITSVSTNVVPNGGTLSFDIQVTDKEGDVTDTIFIKKIRVNKKIPAATLRESFALKIPEAPNSIKGTVRLDLDYQNYLVSAQPATENDTLLFQFKLKDKAKNVSDSVTSGPIVIVRF